MAINSNIGQDQYVVEIIRRAVEANSREVLSQLSHLIDKGILHIEGAGNMMLTIDPDSNQIKIQPSITITSKEAAYIEQLTSERDLARAELQALRERVQYLIATLRADQLN